MHSIRTILPIGLLVAGVLLGCSDRSQTEKPAVSSKSAVPVKPAKKASAAVASPINPAIKPQDPILRINGVDITRAQYDTYFRIQEKVYRRVNAIPMGQRSDKVQRYMMSCKQTFIGVFIRRELLRQAAEKKGVKVTDELFSEAAYRFLRTIRMPRKDLDAALATFLTPAEAAAQRAGIECDALGEAYLRSWSTNDLVNVSDVEVSNRVARVLEINEKTRQLNAESRRKAAAAKAEILAGAGFYEVTTNRCDLLPDQGREWETVELAELEPDEDLCKFLTGAEKGDISDPLDFDDGIGIVGVVLKEKGEVPEGVIPADQYTLVRCLFRGYDPLPLSDDLEDVRQELLDDRRAKARVELGKELMKDAVIEYPSGEAVFKSKARGKAKPAAAKKAARPVKNNGKDQK